MVISQYEVWSDTSRTYRHIRLVQAERGEFEGLWYFVCDCPYGRTGFKPGKPCKHIKSKAADLGIDIPASGHFEAPDIVLVQS